MKRDGGGNGAGGPAAGAGADLVRRLSEGLFWDVDRASLDAARHRRFIIRRVLERGTFEDWKAIKAFYTVEGIVEEARRMRTLEPSALAFVACVGRVDERTFRCYTSKPSARKHWDY